MASGKSVARWLDAICRLDDFTLDLFRRGLFVVRWTDRVFAGVSLDLNIEQTLMASLKAPGGLTHGRTFSDLNSLIWLASRPVTTRLDLKLRQTLAVDYNNAEQSNIKFTTKSEQKHRIHEDESDMKIIERFFCF